MSQVSEADLERIRETVKQKPTDVLAQQEWIARAKLDLASLLEDLTDRLQATGGEFAAALRSAVQAKVVEQLNGRAVLTSQVKEHSIAVHLTPHAVYVDVRLELGISKQASGA